MSANLEPADVLLAGTGLRPSVPSSPTTTPASGSCSRECSRYEDAGPGRQRSAGPAARIAARDHHHRRGCAAAPTRRRVAAQRRPRCPMTDGLVEERGVFLDVNLEKLRVAAQEVNGADVEAFSNHLMSIFGPRQDDVAMIAVRRTPVTR